MTNKTETVFFSLAIGSDEYQRYYRGNGQYVVIQSPDGRALRFPAGWLNRYLTHEGIIGDFVIRYDENRKLVSMEKMESK